MRTSIITCTMLALVLAGCEKSTSDVVLPPECRDFQLAIEDESVNIGRHFEAAFNALRAITNSDRRAACYLCWVDELCKLDVRNLDYIRQAYCIREVLESTRSGAFMVDEYHLPDIWMDITIDSTLKGLSWGQKQLDRIKPTMKIGSSYDYGKHFENTGWNSTEHSRWKYCYGSAWGSYRNSLAHIEGILFDSLCRGRAGRVAARENAKKKIEKFLGRKMRTEEERQRANEAADKTEMKAVEENEVGPDLKKLRPSGGSSK